MEKTDVLVIGGSAAGIIAAVTGKSNNPDKDFMVIRKEKQVIVPCGIPYAFGTLGSHDKNLVPDGVLSNMGIEFKVDEAVSVDREAKVCKTSDGTEIGFDKLIFATGSQPVVPGWLKGTNLENVFTIKKDKEYLDTVLEKLQQLKKVVVIGAGFIGVEMSDELIKLGMEVTLVEILPHILGLAFDEDIAKTAEEILAERGTKIITGAGVDEIIGDGKVSGVKLKDGTTIETDAVILSIGYRPNVGLAKEAGFEINQMGFIVVDEYMRTDDPDFFAVGDCAEKRDFFTRRLSGVMLASTACAESRVAGMNLFELCAVKTFGGTIAVFSTALGDTSFGAAGLTETMAEKYGFKIVTGMFEGIDKHPGTLPGVHKQMVKLVVAPDSGVILGGEAVGGASIGELTNIIGFIVQNKLTVNNLLTAQIGTHPLVTAPPTAYPLIKAAEAAMKQIKSM